MTKVRNQNAIETLQSQITFEESWNVERLARIAEYEAKSRELEAQFNKCLAGGKSLTALELVAQSIDNCVKEISDDKSRVENTKKHIEILKKNLAEMVAENTVEEIDVTEYAVSADAQEFAIQAEIENAKIANLTALDKLKVKIAEQKNKPRKSIVDWAALDDDSEITTLKECTDAA